MARSKFEISWYLGKNMRTLFDKAVISLCMFALDVSHAVELQLKELPSREPENST